MEQINKIDALDLIIPPAFSVLDGVIRACNRAAAARQVPCGEAIRGMIVSGGEEYDAFTDGCLFLTLSVAGQTCDASVCAVDGQQIFILEEDANYTELRSLALAARDLRGILSGIMVTADQFFPTLSAAENPDGEAQISRINRGLFRLLRIVGNMSDAGQSWDRPQETVEFAGLFDEIFEKARTLIDGTGITLHYTGLPATVYGLADTEKLERAVYNILSNALKFTDIGGSIHACLTQRGNRLCLRIQDTGSGIPSELLGSLYARFRRQPGIEDLRCGLGLGMVLIRAAATVHQGTVLVDQPAGGGTRITLTLSVRQSPETKLRSPVQRIDYAGDWDHGLIELSDSLPAELYRRSQINGRRKRK